ncbi:SpaA isopeptide-forming pilin-related protein [Companilactobacillus nodensis]|nr:SpaA isopeptide-forming pilin-related protein [Companilactobacillus nodensis]
MSIKRTSFLISMVAILLALLAWIVPTSETARAATAIDPQPRSIEVNGLGPNDAIIKDPDGNSVPSNDPYYYWSHYNATYNWSIPDGVPIQAGDTAEFELPSNVRLTANLTNIPLLNSSGVQIGTYSIKAGESTGTITFNDVLSSTSVDRKGTINFHVRGTNESTENPGQLDWTINKGGWLYDYDENGLPKYVVWNIAFNPRGENLTNVVVTDTLSEGQTYVDGSVYAPTGSYNSQNAFVSDGGALYPKVTVNGNQIQFHFGDVSTAVDMTFRVLIKVDPSKDNIYNDNATLTSDQVTGDVGASVHYGGSGSGNGSNALGNAVLTKTDESGRPLTGAVYELKDSTGKVLMSDVKVDENGQLMIHDLPAGTYTLTEIKAPDGYELNTAPIEFTIPGTFRGQTINLDQVDYPEKEPEPETGNVVLTKTAAVGSNLLPGAEYDLLDSEGNVLQSGLVTNSEGKIELTGLKVGNYAFKETNAPNGYEISSELIPFTITKDQTTELDAKDDTNGSDESFGGAVLIKTDAAGNLLADAVYELKDSDGNVITSDVTTDKNGEIIFDSLKDGKYTLTEIKAPEGYDVDKTPIEFTIEKGQIVKLNAIDQKTPDTEVPPDNELGEVILTKTDEHGKPLAGAVYELKNSKGNVIGNKYTTDKDGKLNVFGLADGKYTLTEIKAPEGYEVNKTPIEFTIADGKIAEVSAKDKLVPTEPEKPVVPGPSEPGEPSEPEKPTVPGPSEPSEPSEPNEPEEPEKPTVPGPSEPSEPENPVLPGEPEYPNEDDEGSGTATSPEFPSTSTPGLPGSPSTTYPGGMTPGQVGNPGSSGTGFAKFPQTGDKTSILATLAGFIILIGFAGFEVNHKHI